MGESVVDMLHRALTDTAQSVQRGAGRHEDLERWARDLAKFWGDLDLRMRAGDPLPKEWQLARRRERL